MKIDGIEITTPKTYLDLMQRYADNDWPRLENDNWQGVLDGFAVDTANYSATTTLTSPFSPVQYGYIIQTFAELFKHGRGDIYAERALILADRIAQLYQIVTGKYTFTEYQIDSLQFVEGAFAGGPFIKGLQILKNAGKLPDKLYTDIQPVLESSARLTMQLPEWGPFNRCVLRMITLSRFARLYPNSKYAADAEKLSRFLAEDSIGRWNMEDTTLYNGIWYICMAEYFTENNIRNFRTDTIMHYYATYMTQIQLPEGSIPDYGDARTREWGCAALSIGFMEWAAAEYNDKQVKYAVSKYMSWGKKYYGHGIEGGWMSRTYALAADMAAKKVGAEKPVYLSGEVIEDLVGKKIVMRGDDDMYMLLSYKDEGNYALPARQNMYSTIPAPAEKIHHGHADENTITSLCYKNKFLLADGGYRDQIDVDGHYRADFYHNRVVLRNGRMFREKGFLEYAEDLGAYLKVTTEKIFYHELGELHVSRTRVSDPHHRADWDRTVCHFTKQNIFAVVDSVRADQAYEYTLGQMWFGGKITKTGDSDYLIKQTLKQFKGPRGTENLNLRVGFVNKELKTSVEKLRRNHDDRQYALSQYFSEYLYKNEYLCFVTLLLPEGCEADKARNDAIIASADFGMEARGNAMWFSFADGGKKYTVAQKLDEKYGFEDYKHRPTYSFEAGKVSYGDFTTDALFSLFTEDKNGADYSSVMVSRVDYKGKTAFAAIQTQFSNNDLSVNKGAINYVRWDGHIAK